MNVTNGANEVPYSARRARPRRPISALQLATLLALVALPATVLFPIIAEPAPTTLEQPYVPMSLAFEYHRLREFSASTRYHGKIHLQNKPLAEWIAFRKTLREMTDH